MTPLEKARRSLYSIGPFTAGLIFAALCLVIGLAIGMLIGGAFAQDIEVGPVRVDTGDNLLDLGFAVILLFFVALIAWTLKGKHKP